MNLHKLTPLILILGSLFSSLSFGQEKCSAIFDATPVPIVEKVVIPESHFDLSTTELRNTLSGKLATVWRSEWKTKLDVNSSNQYVLDLVNNFLTKKTRSQILQGLDVKRDGFTQQVHARIFNLQATNQIQPHDDLMVRDKPAPQGAKDTTFTYYTKPIVNDGTEGKHQLRVRTYLREVFYEQIPIGQSINGFDVMGRSIEISKVNPHSYLIKTKKNDVVQSQQTLTTSQMQDRFGKSAHFFAPHGKNFKLEVKTALDDIISSEIFPLLGGNHMVQKLDVSLSPSQVSALFAPLTNEEPSLKIKESINRIDHLVEELKTKTPDNVARISAIFNIIKEAVYINPDYLVIEGATFYHRSAFESKSGYQTTIDRDQGVYAGHMYDNNSLKTPIMTVRTNQPIKTSINDARHVELKVPVTSIQNSVGIKFHDPRNAPAPKNTENDGQITRAAKTYHKYVKNANHAGKFNYIRKNGLTGEPLIKKIDFVIAFEQRAGLLLHQSLENAVNSSEQLKLRNILQHISEQGIQSLTGEQTAALKTMRKNFSILRSVLQITSENHNAPEQLLAFVKDFGVLNDHIAINRGLQTNQIAKNMLTAFNNINFQHIIKNTQIATQSSINSYYENLRLKALRLMKKNKLTVHQYHAVRKILKEYLAYYYIHHQLGLNKNSTEFDYLNQLNDSLGIFNDEFTKKMLEENDFTEKNKIKFPQQLKLIVEYFLDNLQIVD